MKSTLISDVGLVGDSYLDSNNFRINKQQTSILSALNAWWGKSSRPDIGDQQWPAQWPLRDVHMIWCWHMSLVYTHKRVELKLFSKKV